MKKMEQKTKISINSNAKGFKKASGETKRKKQNEEYRNFLISEKAETQLFIIKSKNNFLKKIDHKTLAEMKQLPKKSEQLLFSNKINHKEVQS